MDHTSIHIGVIYGSYRTRRAGVRAARWAVAQLNGQCKAHFIDAKAIGLPMLDLMHKEYAKGEAPESMQQLSELLEKCDGFVVVSGEYNHGMLPGLKNLLDHFQREYFFKPAGIVSYSAGRFGGVRAAVHVRAVLGELGMATISTMVPVPTVSKVLNEEGVSSDENLDKAFGRFADELLWYASALKGARAEGLPF